jgi:hypothetical protein
MRTILNFAVAAVLASCCLDALGSGPDKSQPPTSVGSKGPIASVELIRKASIKDESAKPSAPLKGPDWIEMDRKAISGEFVLTSPDNKFSLQLRESSEDEGDIAVYKVALTWKGEDKSVPLGLSTGAVISPDSHYIVLEPFWLIDVEEWKMYDLRRAFESKEGYFGIDRWSKSENKFVLHFVQCPFDCPPDESIEYWLVELRHMAAAAQITYFPISGTSANDGIEKFRSDRYSDQLAALQEPSLWEVSKAQKTESYRFLWLRTFHHPIAIRVDLGADGTAQMTAKMTSGAGGYDPGKLIENWTLTINSGETKRFLGQIDEHNFWKLSSDDKVLGGPDGARWIIEGIKPGTYHIVDRWSPQDGDVRAIGLFMVNELAKLKFPAREVY